jgi:ketosteroid isomerase-like protein
MSKEGGSDMSRATILAGMLVLSIGSAAPAPAQAAKGGEPDFKGLLRKTASAWETLDPAKAAPFYAKDATLAFFDISPLKYTGWNDYRAGSVKVFAAFSSLKISFNDDLQFQRRGNVSWGTGTGHAEVVNKDGSKMPMDFRATTIWEKRGNDWLIVHEHFSVPAPDVAPPAPTR